MRRLHRWPLLHTNCIGFLSRQVLRIAFFATLLLILPHQTHATGKLTLTIWEWTSSICCSAAVCPKTCTYNFTVCIGVPEGNCNFGLLEFTVPHAVPTREGLFFKSTQPFTTDLRIEDDVQVNKNQIIQVRARANPSGVDVLHLPKILRLQPGETQKFKEKMALAAIDFNIDFACDPDYYGESCTVYCKSVPGINHFDCNAATGAKKCHAGWNGRDCSMPICEGGCGGLGDCIAPGVCSCADGWLGPNCAECRPRYGCLHGVCSETPGTCVCEANWTGDLCDQVADKCLERPCKNGGLCKANQMVNFYTCECPDGFVGKDCEIDKAYLVGIETNVPEKQITPENVHWMTVLLQNMGFWIFAIVLVLVAGLIIALAITQKKEKPTIGSACRVGRRNSDIEMDMLRIEVPPVGRDRHYKPPPYAVSELSPLELLSGGPAPPSYAEATAKEKSKSAAASTTIEMDPLSDDMSSLPSPSTMLPSRKS
uniref:Delta-like protein n=1 Tax=Panagrellus redivivus TaxID=6233 RepID=A0A7E4V9S4_PANRE